MDPVLENLQEKGWRKTQGSSHRVLFCHNWSFFCPQSPESQVAGACHDDEELEKVGWSEMAASSRCQAHGWMCHKWHSSPKQQGRHCQRQLVDGVICLVCLLGAFGDLGSRRVVFLPPGVQG